MKFTRRAAGSNYFTSADSDAIVYVDSGYTAGEFDLAKCFTPAFNNPFLIAFVSQQVNFEDPQIKQNFESVLLGLQPGANSKAELIWLDGLQAVNFAAANFLLVTNHNEILDTQLLKGEAASVALRTANKLIVSFDANSSNLMLRPATGSGFLSFIANNGQAAFAGADVQIPNNGPKAGALVLTQGKFIERNAVHAVSPYVNQRVVDEAVKEPVSLVRYLDNEDLKSKYVLKGTFFPFKRENPALGFESVFKLRPVDAAQPQVKSMLLDDNGGKIPATNLDEVELVLGTINLPGRRNRSYLVPRKDSSIEFDRTGNSKNILLGLSGTESINSPGNTFKLKFEASTNIVVDPRKNEISSLADSSVTVALIDTNCDYFSDAERSPRFDNSTKSLDADSRISEYKQIMAGSLNKGERIIPTLSFAGNPDLLEIGQVFSALRTEAVRPATKEAQHHVTPQGFLQTEKRIDFISVERIPSDPDALGLEQENHRFAVTNNAPGPNPILDPHFRLSISKEDTFFVTTPEILSAAKIAGAKIDYDIFFGIRNFKIDLTNYEKKPLRDQKIIIFKYSKRTFDELRRDTTKWSNFGDFRDQVPLKDVAAALNKYIDGLRNTEDYEYLRRIRTDPNWNGLVILNVPLADAAQLPSIFKGLTASQNLDPDDQTKELKLKTPLSIQFIAIPVNKTFIKDGLIDIKSTSFYGLIDYDLVETQKKGKDYKEVKSYFNGRAKGFAFVLSKLLIRFDNSEISNFSSFAFVQAPELFEESIKIEPFKLTHQEDPAQDPDAEAIPNLIRLKGNYQKNSAGNDEFNFGFRSDIEAKFPGSIIEKIILQRAGFAVVKGSQDEYRFDFDGSVKFNPEAIEKFRDFLNFDELTFQNIGFKFPRIDLKRLAFDLSNLIVIPKFKSDGKKGFLSSFPLKFNRFQAFRIEGFKIPKFDFLSIDMGGNPLPENGSLFSLIFDLDLGSLGNLRALKGMKADLLFGWSKGKGFKLGFKLNYPRTDGVDIDYGPFKLFIEKLDIGKFYPKGTAECSAYFIRLVNAKLKLFSIEIPPNEKKIDGLVIANLADDKVRVAWLINLLDAETNALVLGIGQRVGPDVTEDIRTVANAIEGVRDVFKKDLKDVKDCDPTLDVQYKPQRNWLIASEQFLPKAWADVLDFSFIFNDPELYGVHLGLKGETLKGLAIDILYKKLSDTLGVWSLELKLPNELRNIDMGGAAVTLANIGIDIFTDGGWKVDIGYPRGADYSRSCLVQVRPFLGWGGFYFMKARSASVTLFFRDGVNTLPPNKEFLILQAGQAIRVGIGAYIDKGIFFAGASISVFGVLEGAFAFEQGDGSGNQGLQRVFPDHFALQGRVGAIAEIVGYIDFKVLKSTVRIVLREEIGLSLIMIKGQGLLPVPLYLEGSVSVELEYTITCFKVFGRKICITIHLSFSTTIRFQYTLGSKSEGQTLEAAEFVPTLLGPATISIDSIRKVPVVYVPAVTKVKEQNLDTLFIHNFAIPLFGMSATKTGGKFTVNFTKNNLFKELTSNYFSDLIAGFDRLSITSTYENLRSVLLTGKFNGVPVEVICPNYQPWFITGQNLTASDALIQEVFKFSVADLATLRSNLDICDSPEKEKCLFRLIPAPIASKIAVSADPADFKKITEFNNFKLGIHGLVKNQAAEDISLEVVESKNYTAAQIESINTFFDKYKTQFLDRSKAQPLALALEDQFDLRDEAIIPEFFKLIALLTLECYYGTLIDKDPAEPNPTITIDALRSWDIHLHLEKIVGQLNYFYNNGLRLPDQPGSALTTKAMPHILGELSSVTDVSAVPPKDVTVILAPVGAGPAPIDITNDVLGTGEAERNEIVGQLRSAVTKYKPPFDLSVLKNQFDSSVTADPYELVPVKLAIQNGRLRLSNTDRFFEAPEKIAKEETNRSLAAQVFTGKTAADNKNDENITANVAVCALVSMKVVAHVLQPTDKVRVLEIVNVNIDDLNLMNKIKDSEDFITKAQLAFYHHRDEAFSPIINRKATIVKTNLSTKTHPPLIGESVLSLEALEPPPPQYIADTDDRAAFVKLVWEALTTNNGGYFLLLDKELDKAADGFDPSDPGKQYSVVLSFELPKSASGPTNLFPSFCNYFRIQDDPARQIFKKLDDNTNHLFLELLGVDPVTGRTEPIKEYHPRIPAHCMAFHLERKIDRSKPELSQYLPLEFDLSENGRKLISRDSALPIMPTQSQKGTDFVSYDHVVPLLEYDEASTVLDISPTVQINVYPNLKRYKPVDETKKYLLTFGLRDSYGFRAADFNLSEPRPQKYFDKLVPVEAWPLIKFSYWLSDREGSPTELVWELTSVVEMKGLPALVGIKDSEIDGAGHVNPDVLGRVAPAIQSFLESLYTIKAQLSDEKVTVKISQFASNADAKKFLLGRVDEALFGIIQFVKTQNVNVPLVKPTDSILIKQNFSGLRQKLEIEIGIARPAANCVALDSRNVWEDGAVVSTTSAIKLENSKLAPGTPPEVALQQSSLRVLNAAIMAKTNAKDNFCLGISSDENGDREIHVIDRRFIANLKPVQSSPLTTDSYFSIQPYSNTLWSGTYRLADRQGRLKDEENFTNVDLDKSLRAVLARIDDLLSPGFILQNPLNADFLASLKKLIPAKKELVTSQLADKIANINKAELPRPATEDFQNLLLERLNNFYAFDGVVKLNVLAGAELQNHRLTLRINKVPNYNVVSSKLGHRKIGDLPNDEWVILFDQIDFDERIALDLRPEVTHIEFDITRDANSDIESSRWVQLLNPIPLTTAIKVDGITSDTTKQWFRIFREFPPKPVITRHLATQVNSFKPMEAAVWDKATLGQWRYEFGIEDKYIVGDEVIVTLKTKSVGTEQGFAADVDIKGFIAYWAHKITRPFDQADPAKNFDWKEFVEDLDLLLGASPSGLLGLDVEPSLSFTLKKIKAAEWEVRPDNMSKYTVGFPKKPGGAVDNSKPVVMITGFNLLVDDARVISVQPEVFVLRNPRAQNPVFRYFTEKVTTSTLATPHIQYFNVLKVAAPKTLNDVFVDLPGLPFKSTAKHVLAVGPVEDPTLPFIPVRQMEFHKGKPADVETFFVGYQNGNHSLSLTIYNDEAGESELPIFHAELIKRT